MSFSGLETLIFNLECGNNWVLCQINWVSIPKFLKIIEYLPKTYGYFTPILPLSLALVNCSSKYVIPTVLSTSFRKSFFARRFKQKK